MDTTHVTEANLAALSEAKYQKWLRGDNGIPDRDRRLDDLKSQNLQFGGWAHRCQGIWEEFLGNGARQRIKLYKRAARAADCPGMFANQRVDQLRQLIMTGAKHAVMTIKGQIAMAANANGSVSPTLLAALLAEPLYVQLQSRILNIVNAELGVLEAEGRLRLPEAPPDVSNQTARSPGRGGRKRGPATDFETAARVAGVVARVSPHVHWRANLDDVCDGLDDERVPRPKPWKKKGYETWSDCLLGERSLVVKAIGHHMKVAAGRKETFS